MNLPEIISAQYLAALQMMEQLVRDCPDALWLEECSTNQYWHVAYHALFFTHLYLHPDAQSFQPWAKHRETYEQMGPTPWPPHEMPKIGAPYTRAEVLEFLQVCRDAVDRFVPSLDLEAASGFDWQPVNKLELQIYNIRHLQQHAGELSDRLGSRAGIAVDWVGSAQR